jgi:hypothetical protein
VYDIKPHSRMFFKLTSITNNPLWIKNRQIPPSKKKIAQTNKDYVTYWSKWKRVLGPFESKWRGIWWQRYELLLRRFLNLSWFCLVIENFAALGTRNHISTEKYKQTFTILSEQVIVLIPIHNYCKVFFMRVSRFFHVFFYCVPDRVNYFHTHTDTNYQAQNKYL